MKKKSSVVSPPQLGEDLGGDTVEKEKSSVPEDVLVITVVPPADCPGMIPEKKVGPKSLSLLHRLKKTNTKPRSRMKLK